MWHSLLKTPVVSHLTENKSKSLYQFSTKTVESFYPWPLSDLISCLSPLCLLLSSILFLEYAYPALISPLHSPLPLPEMIFAQKHGNFSPSFSSWFCSTYNFSSCSQYKWATPLPALSFLFSALFPSIVLRTKWFHNTVACLLFIIFLPH